MITAASRVLAQEAAAPEPPAPHGTVRLVPFEPGFYAVSLDVAAAGDGTPEGGADNTGLRLPAVQICVPPRAAADRAIEITDARGRPAAWLAPGELLLVAVRQAGTALATSYLEAGGVQPALEIRRLDASGGALPAESRLLPVAEDPGTTHLPPEVRLDFTAHIRGRGDVAFTDAAGVARLGAGLWIEALTIRPRDPAAAATIELKGLLANGAETPWVGCGAVCGVTGQGLPLIGFAVRQRAAPAQPLFDCEYGGQFQSGATVGPLRNGAPCRSPRNGDPLEGMQLRLIRRSPPIPAG